MKLSWGNAAASGDSDRAKARKRLSRLATGDLINWADQAGSGMAKGFDDYRRLRSPEALAEVRIGLNALLAVVDELEARH